MFSYGSPEKRVPADHPLRPIRKRVDEILKEMSPQLAKNQEWRARHNGFTPTESDRTANDSALGRF
jgi:hypothetical protein